MSDHAGHRNVRLGISVVLEILLVGISLYGMIVAPGLMAFAAGFLGFSVAVIRRSLRRAADRTRLASAPLQIDQALDLLESTSDWKFDVLEFGFIALVLTSAYPTALQALRHDVPSLAAVLGFGIAASAPALFLSGREAVSRIQAQVRSRRLLRELDEEFDGIEAADDVPTLGSA